MIPRGLGVVAEVACAAVDTMCTHCGSPTDKLGSRSGPTGHNLGT